jgi:glycolate oxidase FAD binding subunit
MPDPTDMQRELAAAVGGAMRPAGPEDAVDGVRAGWVVEPASAEGAASALEWCSTRREPVLIRGGATHLAWGRPPARIGVIVSTRRLDRIVRYEPGDLTVTVEAGASIAGVNQQLARQGQWLPLDVLSDAATIGGAIATNDSGPLRHRYGTPRDQVIGIRLATADGRLASAGGQVVKNVAGYDLSKLMAGSFGTLAAIVAATFKLAPRPAATATLVVEFDDGRALAAAAAAIGASQLDPMCLEAEASFGTAAGYRLIVRFGGTPAANEDQAAAARALAARTGSRGADRIVTGSEDEAFWRDWRARRGDGAGALVRASWMPARLADVLKLLGDVHRDGGAPVALSARAAVGSGTIAIGGDTAGQAAAVQRLRGADALGHVVLVRADAALKAAADVWGAAPPAFAIAAMVKAALDPSGILNAARGPI